MSWRQFLALVNNLSPEGAVARRMREEQKSGDELTDKQAADAFFQSVVAFRG